MNPTRYLKYLEYQRRLKRPRYLSIYLEMIKIRFKCMSMYRLTFFTSTLAYVLGYGSTALLLWVMVSKFKMMNGWSAFEVMFLYALNVSSYAIAGFFLFKPTSQLSTMIRTGDFDETLIRPLNPFIYLVTRDFVPEYVVHLSISATILVLCIVKLQLSFTLIRAAFLAITILGAAMIQGAAFIATSVPSFWMIKNSSLAGTLFFGMRAFVQYPLSLYNRFIQIILTLVLPYAFINFYPAQYFLRKDDFLIFGPVMQYLTPVVGIVLFTLAYRFWKSGVNHYNSTGS